MKYSILIVSIAACFCLFGCQSNSAELLGQVESYINERPDSALAALEAMDKNILHSDRAKAKFALLYSMALDKNYIDIEDDSIINVAVRYYDKHGDSEERMKSYYYLGRIHSNARNYDEAMKCFQESLDASVQTHDYYLLELIYSAMSDVNSWNYNARQAQIYATKAYDSAVMANDTLGIWILTARLASVCAENHDFCRSDSLYTEFLSMPVMDSAVYCSNLLYYSRNQLVYGSNQEIDRYVNAFNEVLNNSTYIPEVYDYCAYAYILELKGEHSEADHLMNKLRPQFGQSSEFRIWEYRIQKQRKAYASALSLFESIVVARDSIIHSALNQSIASAQADYFAEKSQKIKIEKENTKYKLLSCILVLLLVLILSAFYFFRKYVRWMRRIDELTALQDEIRHQNIEQGLILDGIKEKIEVKDMELLHLRREYVSLFKSQFQTMDELCANYFLRQTQKEKDKIYEDVKSRLSDLISNVRTQAQFEELINGRLDNIMLKLRKDLPGSSDNDFRFMSLIIAGFSSKSIACLMGYTPGTVYVKKNRLKERIKCIDSEYKDFYLMFIS